MNRNFVKMKLTIEDLQYIINETVKNILTEDVYADRKKIDLKHKKVGLTYSQHKGKNHGQFKGGELIKTDRMEEKNANTYIVPLKGGINSYNITDISGVEIMHYFKRLWDNKKTYVKVDNEDWELTMLKQEESEFMNTFVSKIEYIVRDYISNNSINNEEIRAISIYPVDSSSHFNDKMAEKLSQMSVDGLPVQIINKSLLVKDLRNLEMDNDFITKNQDYYNGKYTQTKQNSYGTVQQELETAIGKEKALREVQSLIPTLNEYSNALVQWLHNSTTKPLSEKVLMKMTEVFKEYHDTFKRIVGVKYYDQYKQKQKGVFQDSVIVQIKYTKGPSVDIRKKKVWEMVKPYLRGQISPVTNKPYTPMDICNWDPKRFEIKYLSNPLRMGLKNIYNPNTKTDLVQQELEKIKGTLFIIFDDNISGGATLSDICYQCKQLGIEYLIPITFGQMRESNTIEMGVKLSTPKNGYNLS